MLGFAVMPNVTQRWGSLVLTPTYALSSHYGHVSLDPVTHVVTFAIEAAYSPNWKPTGANR
ncbi:hypothetical protein DVJ77_07675 [Dyella tabacisoli]|uniref:Uncharacterized protein n=1 Tax=Dyella tabacisoli TaxID=2282381 RepID=A0A369UP27_9GAMM|nr:hypothetical protein DVJ77_07675 [Dyella tabacisoli]